MAARYWLLAIGYWLAAAGAGRAGEQASIRWTIKAQPQAVR